MKIKGITIWEQYAEFILLGAVGVVFCIYLASSFFLDQCGSHRQRGDDSK